VRDASEKEGGHGHRPCEETRVLCSVSVRRVSLQKSAGSILAPNKVVRSTPKRATVRVNGGLARQVRRRESAGGVATRKDAWRVGLHAFLEKREGPAETQDDVRASFSGRDIVERRWRGRGTGAVKATGSHEGSLSVEGTSGCHEPSPFTRRWSRRPWRLPHAGKGGLEESTLKDARRRSEIPAPEGEATEVSEVRSISWRRGKTTPTLGAHAPDTVRRATRGNMAARAQHRSAEAFSGVVKRPVPRSTVRSPRLRGESTR